MQKKKVILALSGGIDSTMSLKLLVKKYNVEAVFVKCWDDTLNFSNVSSSKCNWYQNYKNALIVANIFNVKLHIVSLEKEYWEKVFIPYIKEIINGFNPNPDIECNRVIKFSYLKNIVLNKYKGDFFATGHYAKIIYKNNNIFLASPKDKKKDQTYFLSNLSEKHLENVLFPLENMTKDEIKIYMKNSKDLNLNYITSKGICFIEDDKYSKFIKHYVDEKPGKIIDINTNKTIGDHIGVSHYTIGQHKNLNINGKNSQNKYYTIKKDIKKNLLYVGIKNHKLLFKKKIYLKKIHFINKIYKDTKFMKILFKIRHSSINYKGSLFLYSDNDSYILSDEPIKHLSPGQNCVFYKNNICLGNGQIR